MWNLYALAAVVVVFGFWFSRRCPFFVQDCRFVMRLLRNRWRLAQFRKREPPYLILECFLEAVHKQPHKTFLLFEEEVYTYLQVDRWSNRAAWALREHGGLRDGDTAAMLVGNEPNFVFLWLGLMKLGCAASLLNTNLRGKSLMHCFTCCGAKVLIAAEEYHDAVLEVLPELRERGVCVLMLCDHCKVDGLISLKDKMKKSDDSPVSRTMRANTTMRSNALYIYTSGTTGLPKAAVYSHAKMWLVIFYPNMTDIKHDDVVYVPLPLYHANGLLIGVGGAIERGNTVVLRRKFSVSQFWNDCRKYNVTVILYIGEIMRYLCNTPVSTTDREHRVRLALGNGIRAEVWEEFLRRFGSVKIFEFYGGSDGNVGFLNYTGKVGAVGRATLFHRTILPYTLIQYDTEKEEPVRDSRGHCIPVPTGETGLFITKITAMAPYLGYAGNLAQTEKRKLHNVFENGDIYLNIGDLMRVDHQGFVYFQDRIGDTFRWKAENVATTEVADIISMLDFIKEVNVYGVKVPGHEGRIGMAAVSLKENHEFDCMETFNHVTSFLPVYARPRFIRIVTSFEVTGTFKHVKTSLMKDGFDPEKVTPPIYILQESSKSYVPFTHVLYSDILSGNIRF